MDRANVGSIEAIDAFRSDLIRFIAEIRESLTNEEIELRRGLDWLLNEQPDFWRREIRAAEDAVLEGKTNLMRCRGMRLPDGSEPSCSEEKAALDKAKRRLEHAQDKSEATKRWGHLMDHEAGEYSSRARQLDETLTTVAPRAVGLLDRVLAALEQYTTMSPPGEDVAPSRALPTSESHAKDKGP